MRSNPVRAAAVATALSLAVTACTTSSTGEEADRGTTTAAADPSELSAEAVVAPRPETVRGWVSFGEPVVGATVTVWAPGGTTAADPVVTDEFGYFESAAPYGPDHLVVAQGGTAGGDEVGVLLRAQLNTDDPEAEANIGYVDVNMASTLVVEHLERHPELDEEQAEAAVATALGAHPDTDLSGLVGADPALFDPVRFVHPSGSDETGPEGVDPTGEAAPDDAGTDDVAAPVTPVGEDHVDAVADRIAAGGDATDAFRLANPVAPMARSIVESFFTSQGEKLLTRALGLDDGDETAAELRAMRAQLDQLQVALTEVAAVDATNSVRGGIRTATRLYMEPVADRAIKVNQARAELAALGDEASAEEVATAERAVADAEALYDKAVENFRGNYNTLAGGAFVTLNNYLEAGPGQAKSIVAKYGDTLRSRRFITKAESDALFAVYDDFASWQATAAYLEAEYQAAIEGNVTGAIALFEEAVEGQVAQLPARITVPGVVVDLTSNLMWEGGGSRVLHWEHSPHDWSSTAQKEPPGTPPGPAPFSGWRLPRSEELTALVRDRGNRNVREYMVSISTPNGFSRGFWQSVSAPIWASNTGTDQVTIVGSPWDTRTWWKASIGHHHVLRVDGKVDHLPTMAGYEPKLEREATAWINRRVSEANAHVVQVRSLSNGERYL